MIFTLPIRGAFYINGRRKVQTKHNQIVRPVKGLPRFIYACLSKRLGDNYAESLMNAPLNWKIYNPTNWRKDNQPLLRVAGGKLGKSRQNFKAHLFGCIYHRLISLATFGGAGYSKLAEFEWFSPLLETRFHIFLWWITWLRYLTWRCL